MNLLTRLYACAVFAAMASAQTPTITAVANAASGNIQALPNGGIAQGAIFTVYGSNIGPASLAVDAKPFTNTKLLGTSVSISISGKAVDALLYYTSASQVAALLPSTTPTGSGELTVTYNGVVSAPAPVTVVQNNVGIFTTPSGGAGAAVITYPDYSVVSAAKSEPCGGPNTACGAANPKDILILWLTGLGPVPKPDSSGPQPGNMADIPLKLWIGGVQAQVSYQGRSGCCIGVDQVIFTVPDNAPTGCAVPIFIQINDQISNYGWVPVATGSRSCTPTDPSYTPGVLSAIASGKPVTLTQIKLRRRPKANGQGTRDHADAQVQRVTTVAAMLPFALTLLDIQPIGTCVVVNNPNVDVTAAVVASVEGIDAGQSLTLSGPNGNQIMAKTVMPGQPTDYFVSIGASYFSPGAYTVMGAGGTDIGPFSAMLNIPAMPVWTNQANISTVTRSKGLTINWTGGSGQQVAIFGAAYTDPNQTTGAVFLCRVSGEAGTFTVPPQVLLALPAMPAGPNSVLTFQAGPPRSPFTATGLTLGSIDFNANVSSQVAFQ